MPHFRFRAVEPSVVQTLSKTLIDDLDSIMQSPRADFTFESVHTTFFHEGCASDAYPLVELLWFDRGQEIQDKVAMIVTNRLKELVGASINVAVIFTALKPSQYYDNAVHY